MLVAGDYSGHLLFFFENGKAAKVPLESYATKTNRRKLIGAYSDKSPLVSMLFLREDCEIATYSSDGRAILFNTALLAPKVSRTTQGVIVMTLKKGRSLTLALPASETPIKNASRYRVRKLPSSGALVREEDAGELQLSFLK